METEVLSVMGLLGPVMGNGQINGNCGIWRPTTIIDEAEIEPGFNIEVGSDRYYERQPGNRQRDRYPPRCGRE